MEITKKIEGNELTVFPVGKIDTTTTPMLEAVVSEHLDEVESVVIDMEKTNLISSACLRYLLLLHKTMMKKQGMRLRNVGEMVYEVLDFTGFIDIFTIE